MVAIIAYLVGVVVAYILLRRILGSGLYPQEFIIGLSVFWPPFGLFVLIILIGGNHEHS